MPLDTVNCPSCGRLTWTTDSCELCGAPLGGDAAGPRPRRTTVVAAPGRPRRLAERGVGGTPFAGAVTVAALSLLLIHLVEGRAGVGRSSPRGGSGRELPSASVDDLAIPEPPVPEAPAAEIRLTGPDSVAIGRAATWRVVARSTVSEPIRVTMPKTALAAACGAPVDVVVSPTSADVTIPAGEEATLGEISLPSVGCGRGYGTGMLRFDVQVGWPSRDWIVVQPVVTTWLMKKDLSS